MSIATKLTYLNTTKGKIKDSINNLGGSIDSNTTFRDYATQLDSIYNRLPKVSGTGSDITLTPTLKGRLGSVPKGNTYQFTTTGKNLLNIISSSVSNRGVDLSISDHTHLVLYGTATQNYPISRGTLDLVLNTPIPAGTYTFSVIGTYNGSISTKAINWEFYDENDNLLVQNTNIGPDADSSKTFTVSSPIKAIKFFRNMLADTSIDFDLYLQLESGSSATSYEPYTGNQPSPNPSYPQDIQCAEGIQNISVYGKNLFDGVFELGSIDNSTGLDVYDNQAIRSKNYIKVSPNTIYTVSTENNCSIFIHFYSEDKTYLSYNNVQNTPKTFTTPNNCEYVRLRTRQAENITDLSLKCQLEKGSQATTYQSYQTPQTQEVNLGDIKLYNGDYITGTPDNWNLVHEWNDEIFDGTESGWGTEGKITNYYRYQKMLSNATQSDNNLCSHFKYLFNYNQDVQHFYISSSGRLYIFSTETSLNDFKTWLSTHNTKIVYKLATPTTTPITDTYLISQLNALYNAKSYDEQTNISVEGNLPMILEVSALKGE